MEAAEGRLEIVESIAYLTTRDRQKERGRND